jgi:hypothetical protein
VFAARAGLEFFLRRARGSEIHAAALRLASTRLACHSEMEVEGHATALAPINTEGGKSPRRIAS